MSKHLDLVKIGLKRRNITGDVYPLIIRVTFSILISLILFGCGDETPPSLSFQNLAGSDPISTQSLPYEVNAMDGDSTTIGLSLKGVTFRWNECCIGKTQKMDAKWQWSDWPDSIIVSAAIDIIQKRPLEFSLYLNRNENVIQADTFQHRFTPPPIPTVKSIEVNAFNSQNSMVLPSIKFDEKLLISATGLKGFMSLDIPLREKVLHLASMMKYKRHELQTIIGDPKECMALEMATAKIELEDSESFVTAMWIPSDDAVYRYTDRGIEKHRREVAQVSLYKDSAMSDMSLALTTNDSLSSGFHDLLLISYDDDSYSSQRIARICVDNEPPDLFCGFPASYYERPHLGCVTVNLESWQGYINDYISVPFTGTMYGDVKALYVDNKRVFELKKGNFFFRKNLYIQGGYNEFEVKAVDRLGNVSRGIVRTTTESIPQIDIDVHH